MKMKKFLSFLLLAFVALALVACGKDPTPTPPEEDADVVAQELINSVTITYAEGDSQTAVTKDITLGKVDNAEATLSWASDNGAITNTGAVTRGDADVEVTLTASLTYKEVNKVKSFKLTVKAKEVIPPAETEVSTISEVKDVADETNVRIKGTVVACNATGFYVYDQTGFIQVYMGSTEFTQKLGDYVDVEGPVTTYKGNKQFGNTAVIKPYTDGTAYEAPVSQLDAEGFTSYLESVELGKKVQVEVEVISADKNYVNTLFKGSNLDGVALMAPKETLDVGAKYLVTVFSIEAKEFEGVNYLYGFLEEAILTEAAPLPEYTVTFDCNGGDPIAPITFTDYTTVELPVAEYFGFFFFEWVDENDQAVSALTENKNYTLKAKWFQATTDVKFNLDGGSFVDGYLDGEGKRHFDSAIYAYQIAVPTKEGKVFLGWLGADGVIATEFAGDVELTAAWGDKITIELNCGVSYNLSNAVADEFIKDFNAQTGKNLTKLSFFDNTYTSDGTTFVANFFADEKYHDKWAWLENFINDLRNENGLLPLAESENASQRGEIHNWLNHCAPGECGGNASYGQDYSSLANYVYNLTIDGTEYTLPTLSRDGYTFLGWYPNPKFVGDPITTTNNGLPVYAKFEVTNYKVEYVLPDGAINSENNPVTYTMFSGEITFADATVAEGKTFTGWYRDPEFTQKVEGLGAGATGDIKLYGRVVEGEVVTVTFDYNNAKTQQEIIAEFVKDVEELSGKTGYLSSKAKDGISSSSDYNQLKAILDWEEGHENYAKKMEFLAKWNWLFQCIIEAQEAIGSSFVDTIKTVVSGHTNQTGAFIIAKECEGIREKVQASNYYSAVMYNWETDTEGLYDGISEKSKQANFTDKFAKGSTITQTSKKGDLEFTGWYNNPECTGDALTVIPDADCTLYAGFHSPTTLYVDASCTDGTKFTSLAEAVKKAYNNDTIVVAAGTYAYAEAIVINKTITILGPNAEKAGNANDRAAEAVVNAPINVNADNVVLKGLAFMGDDNCIADDYNSGAKRKIKAYNGVKGFEFVNNYATSNNILIDMADNTKTVINNNFFNWTADTTAGTAYWRPFRFDGNTTDFEFCGNKVIQTVTDATSTGFMDILYFKKVLGTCDVNSNDVNLRANNWLYNVATLGDNAVFSIKDSVFTNDECPGFALTNVSPSASVIITNNKFHTTGTTFSILAGTTSSPKDEVAATQTGLINISGNTFTGSVFKPRMNPTLPEGTFKFECNLVTGTYTSAGTKYKQFTEDMYYKDEAKWASAYNAYTEGTLYNIVLNGKTYTAYDVLAFELPTFAIEGNTFLGWYDGDTKVEALTELKDYNLSSKFEHGYIVIFDGNGGSESDALIYDTAQELVDATLPTPTKEGYDFDCWMNGEEKFVPTLETELKNYTLVAKWARKFTITYDYNIPTLATLNLELINSQRASRFNIVNDKANTFTFWNKLFLKATDVNGVYTVVAASAGSEGKAINTFDPATFDYVLVCSYDSCQNADAKAFFEASKLESYIGLTVAISGDLTQMSNEVEALPGQFVVTFHNVKASNYGKLVVNKSGLELPITIDEVPTYEGFIFNGWYNGTTKVTSLTTSDDVELKAAWKVDSPYLYPTKEELLAAYMADFNTVSPHKVNSAEGFDTSQIDSDDMSSVLINKDLTAKWMWFYKALCDANSNTDMYPDAAGFTADGAKGFYLANLYGFFMGCKHSDTYLSTVSADYSDESLCAAILAKSPLKPGAEVALYTAKVLPGCKMSGSETKWYCATQSETGMSYLYAEARLILVADGNDYKVSAILAAGAAIEGDYAYRVVILDGSTYSAMPTEIQVGQKVVITEEAGYLVMNFYAGN